MKTLKVLLQEVVSGIKAWVNSNFAQESNTVHKTGNETVNGVKTFSEGKIVLGTTSFAREAKGSTTYEMTASDFYLKFGFFKITQFKDGTTSAPRGNNGDYDLIGMSPNTGYGTYLCTSPRNDLLWYGKFWESVWQGWKEVVNCESNQTITGGKTFTNERISFRHPTYVRGTSPSSPAYLNFTFGDSKDATTARILRYVNTDGSNALIYQVWNTQVTTDTSGAFSLGFDEQGKCFAQFKVDDVNPTNDNSVNLGTTTNRWKSFNGVDPGALSLPDYSKAANIDTTNWNTAGTKIDYTPPENCLIQIVTHNESGNKITVLNKYTSPEWGNCVCGNGHANNLFFEKLLEGGRTYYIYITDTNASPAVRARYVPLFGNV